MCIRDSYIFGDLICSTLVPLAVDLVKIQKPLPLSLIHISEPTRLLSISYAVFCLKKKKKNIFFFFFFFLMIRRPPRSTLDRSSAASDVYKRQAVDLVKIQKPLP